MRQVRGGLPGQGHQHQTAEVANAPGGQFTLWVRIGLHASRRTAHLASSHCSARIALRASRRTARAPRTRERACAPASGRYSLSRVVSPRCLPQAMALAHPFEIAPACLPVIAQAKPRAPRRKKPRGLSCGAFCARRPPVFVCPLRARSRETRYVCVLIAPGAVAPETSNTFPQVTAPRITPLATRRALKHRRIASPVRLRPRVHVTRLLPLRFALVSLRLKLCKHARCPTVLAPSNLLCKPCKRIDRHLQGKKRNEGCDAL